MDLVELLLGAAVVAVAGVLRWLGRDEVYAGVPIGTVPPAGAAVERRRVRWGSVDPRPDPPEGVTVADVAFLYHLRSRPAQPLSTVFDLAHRGHLTVVAGPRRLTAPAWSVTPVAGRDDMSAYEQELIRRLSSTNDLRRASRDLPTEPDDDEMVRRGWLRRSSMAWLPTIVILVAGAVATVAAWGHGRWASVLVTGIATLVGITIAVRWREPTALGNALRAQAFGFWRHLQDTPAPASHTDATALVSAGLPYAVAMGSAGLWLSRARQLGVPGTACVGAVNGDICDAFLELDRLAEGSTDNS